jgi:hypothetical protein
MSEQEPYSVWTAVIDRLIKTDKGHIGAEILASGVCGSLPDLSNGAMWRSTITKKEAYHERAKCL